MNNWHRKAIHYAYQKSASHLIQDLKYSYINEHPLLYAVNRKYGGHKMYGVLL